MKKFQLPLFTTLMLSWFLCLAQHPAAAADSLERTAKKLVRQLDKQFQLENSVIQVSGTNFSEQVSEMRPAFSARLAEELTAALSAQGAMITSRETGEEPLRLLGVYHHVDTNLEIHLRLRKMGSSASSDIAAVRTSMEVSPELLVLLQNSLDSLAADLIAQLEQNFYSSNEAVVDVLQPLPAVTQPSLKLGAELKKKLQLALARSELFGEIEVVGVGNQPIALQATYSIAEAVTFTVVLQKKDGTAVCRGEGRLQKQEIPPSLFEQIDDQKRAVCVSYQPANRRAVSAKSPTIRVLLDEIEGVLTVLGIEPVPCSNTDQTLQLAASLQLRQKKMGDGYGMLTGELTLEIKDGDKAIGHLRQKATASFSGHVNDARPGLIEKLFTPQLQKKLGAEVLKGRQ